MTLTLERENVKYLHSKNYSAKFKSIRANFSTI